MTFTPSLGFFFVEILENMNGKKNEMQATSLSKVFTFNPSNQPIRAEVINQQPWFVAKDICDVLGLENSRKATTSLDDDEKGVSLIVTPSGKQKMTIVSESGLYYLIFQSRKPEAKPFRKWVTSEVLPQIRQTGSYTAPANGMAYKKLAPAAPAKTLPTQQFYENLCSAINIAGGQKKLADYMRISESIVCDIFARPNKSSYAMRDYMALCCEEVLRCGRVPAAVPADAKPPRIRRNSHYKLDIMLELCKIDNSELRASLIDKVMKGGRA